MGTLNIGQDFSPDPSGRYKSDGPASGEVFREEFLKPSIEKLATGEKLTVVLDDGVEGYGSSFLVEGFAAMVKLGYVQKEDLLNKLEFSYADPEFKFYEKRIIQYIKDAVPPKKSGG